MRGKRDALWLRLTISRSEGSESRDPEISATANYQPSIVKTTEESAIRIADILGQRWLSSLESGRLKMESL